MPLAVVWAQQRDGLTADFQQFYGLNAWAMGLDGDETTPEVRRAAVLLSQLPAESRLVIKECPDAAWRTEAQILRSIEYMIRVINRNIVGKGDKPKPIELPSERAKHAEIIDKSVKSKAQVDAALAAIFPKRNKS